MIKTLENQSANYLKIKETIEYISKSFKDQPSVEEIALHVNLSKYHFSRVFKEYVGVTPLQFLHSTTFEYAKEHLKKSNSILDTTCESGLSSSSRLHELFINFIGVTPKEYKELGKDLNITCGYGFSPFGKVLLGFTCKGICYMEFCDNNEKELLQNLMQHWFKAKLVQDDKQVQNKLNDIFLDQTPFKLFVKGTNFQINVWKALLNIPSGTVTTYQNIAQSIDKPKAVRAVASAIGSNTIAYLIPCHRVIGKSGAMSGYRWGLERKQIAISYEKFN